jgi:hypothetical protein
LFPPGSQASLLTGEPRKECDETRYQEYFLTTA